MLCSGKELELQRALKMQGHMWTFKSAEYKLTEYSYHWQVVSFNSIQNQVTYKHYNTDTDIIHSVCV